MMKQGNPRQPKPFLPPYPCVTMQGCWPQLALALAQARLKIVPSQAHGVGYLYMGPHNPRWRF